jgi:hypothetical protein
VKILHAATGCAFSSYESFLEMRTALLQLRKNPNLVDVFVGKRSHDAASLD